MDIDKVRELVKLVEESGIEQLEVSHDDTTIRIQKSAPAGTVAPVAAYAPPPLPPEPAAAPAAVAPVPEADATRAKWRDVRSPIVGTYYRAPSPTAEPFVQIGDRVAKGQTLCIVEAMKVMNEIEAEFGGVIKEVLVENATPVEAETLLYLVDPD